MNSHNVLERYDYIRRIAPAFTQQIEAAAQQAHNEAEFAHAMNNAIASVAGELGIEMEPRQEYVLATGGRADAVYNRFIIEYEPPGSLRATPTHGHTRHAIQQVKDYIVGLAKSERQQRDRLFGAVLDGHYFVFVRYHEGHFLEERPLEVNGASTERFLRSLFSLASGRALIPGNLVEDFGSQNVYSQQVTRALYNALETNGKGLPAHLYAQWRLFFGEVAGFEAAEGKLRHRSELHQFAHGMGLKPAQIDAPRLFFAIHTYFSFLVKNIARLVLQAHAGGAFGAMPLTTIASLQGQALRHELENMESGGIFRVLGLKNLLEGDFFSWYLTAWDSEIEEALRLTLARLAEYNPSTVQDDPHSARDLLKKLYHYLLPREIRHDLGEFYTPDWLAERLLTQLNEPLFQMPRPGRRVPKPDKRLLDPASGSGTFLVLAIRALKANCQQAGLSGRDTLEIILDSVVGIDLNPLAVLAARVNYLLAIADLIPERRREVEIPVYLADSVLTPGFGKVLWEQKQRILQTAVGRLPVPEAINTRAGLDGLTAILEEYVNGGFSTETFLQRCRASLPDIAAHPESEPVLAVLFERLAGLHRQGLDSIWARVLKNAFMPLFLEPFDYVVGNPPWINWQSLPQGYRDQTAPLWQDYGLFVHSGMDTILGKGKKDFSTLMTYAVADRFLKDGGKLGFVITQSVWKTAGAGQGFRRFRIGKNGPPLRVLHVDDLSRLQVFEGASTRTTVFVAQKGEDTHFPVPYTYWQKTVRSSSLDYDSTLEEIQAITRRLRYHATPVRPDDPTSAWLTARPKALGALGKVLGQSDYQAREGCNTGGANGVYCVQIDSQRPDGLVVVRNVTEGAKRAVHEVALPVELGLLYPLLRGRDAARWMAHPSLHVIMAQDPRERRGIDENVMQKDYPKTWAYLKHFEATLRQRSGFRRYFIRQNSDGKEAETGPFYSLFNVGEYTFAPWKVVWTRVGNDIKAAVIGERPLFGHDKPVIPLETATMVGFAGAPEAHYFCAYVNSSLFRLAVNSYSVHGTGGFGSPHILTNVRVPAYDPTSTEHLRLTALSQQAHELAPLAHAGDGEAQGQLRQTEADVDRAAAALWGLSDEELSEVQKSLKELRG